MKRSLVFILAGIAVVAALTSCRTLLDIRNPDYSIVGVQPEINIGIPLSASTIDFDIVVEIDNPNGVGLNLDQIDFSLLVDGRRVADGVTTREVRIPANGSATVPIRTTVGYREIRAIFDEVVQAIRGEETRYGVEGQAHYRTPIGRMSFPFSVYRTRL